MKTSIVFVALAAIIALAATSCTTPSSPTTTGDNDIHGYVELWDSCGGRDANLEGVVVTAATSTWSSSDTTGVDGTWSIPDAPAGVYTINAIRGSYLAPPITNMQYVGSGKYDVKKVWLAASIPAGFVKSANVVSTSWYYETQTLENGTELRYDSAYTIKVSVDTKCAMTGSLDYRITETPDADCDSFVLSEIKGVPVSGGTTQVVLLGGAYKKLVARYGASLSGKHLYLQIRTAKTGKRIDGTVGCLDPVVVDLFY